MTDKFWNHQLTGDLEVHGSGISHNTVHKEEEMKNMNCYKTWKLDRVFNIYLIDVGENTEPRSWNNRKIREENISELSCLDSKVPVITEQE